VDQQQQGHQQQQRLLEELASLSIQQYQQVSLA